MCICHAVLLHDSSPCMGHACSWMWGLIHSPSKAPLMLAAESVCGLTPVLPQRDVNTHSVPKLQWGAGAGRLHSATDSTHFYLLPLSRSLPLFLLYSSIFSSSLSPSVVTTERSSDMCGWLSKLTCLSERHESTTGRLPKTTTFRSHSRWLC